MKGRPEESHTLLPFVLQGDVVWVLGQSLSWGCGEVFVEAGDGWEGRK